MSFRRLRNEVWRARRDRRALIAFGGLAALTLLVSASTAFGQGPAPSPGQLVPRTLAPGERLPPGGVTLAPARGRDAPPGAERALLRIGDVAIEGGDPALSAEAEAIRATLRGRAVAVADIYAAAARLERAYAERGYFLTRVVVPPQDARHGGTLRLVVIEGFIEAVDLSGVPPAARARVEALIMPMIGQRRLRLATFERKLLLAGDVPGVALRSTLTTGRTVGGVLLRLEGEHRPISGEVSADNSLSRQLGREVLTLSASANSVLGLGEQVYVSLSGAPGHGWLAQESPRRLVAGGFVLPIGADGLSFNLESAWSNTAPRVPPSVLPTFSEFRRLSFRLSYPIVRGRTETLTARAVFDVIDEDQWAPTFGNVTLYADRLRPIRFGLDWARVLETGTTISLGGDLSRGLSLLGSRGRLDATTERPISRALAEDDYTKAEIRARLFQALPHGFGLDLSARAQYSFTGSLLNGERFSLGGPRALSAFDAGALTGDHGWLTRVELQYAHAFAGGVVVPYLFVSRGQAINAEASAAEARIVSATNAGLGARMTMGPEVAAVAPRGFDLGFEIARQFIDGPQADEWRINAFGAWRF